jgi:hypothetical protein
MLNYVLHSEFNVTLSEAKGLTSYDRFFATLRMTFWAKPVSYMISPQQRPIPQHLLSREGGMDSPAGPTRRLPPNPGVNWRASELSNPSQDTGCRGSWATAQEYGHPRKV